MARDNPDIKLEYGKFLLSISNRGTLSSSCTSNNCVIKCRSGNSFHYGGCCTHQIMKLLNARHTAKAVIRRWITQKVTRARYYLSVAASLLSSFMHSCMMRRDWRHEALVRQNWVNKAVLLDKMAGKGETERERERREERDSWSTLLSILITIAVLM